MTNQMKSGIEHTRVPSAAAMRARDVSRDPEAEALGLRQTSTTPDARTSGTESRRPEDDEPQPSDRRDS